MKKIVLKPNLPENAAAVLIGEEYADLVLEALKQFDVSLIKVPKNPYVDRRLSSHADLSIFHAGDTKIFLSAHLKNSSLQKELSGLGFHPEFISRQQSALYPHDCQLNICSAGQSFIYSQGISDSRIIDFLAKEKGLTGINIKQGYAKCSICVVDYNSVITSDQGAAKALKAAGYDVLEIQAGHINLEGFTYGFIGGASFKLSNNLLAFTGLLDKHPDKARIFSFLRERHIDPVFLTNEDIFDVGSIIPILEK